MAVPKRRRSNTKVRKNNTRQLRCKYIFSLAVNDSNNKNNKKKNILDM